MVSGKQLNVVDKSGDDDCLKKLFPFPRPPWWVVLRGCWCDHKWPVPGLLRIHHYWSLGVCWWLPGWWWQRFWWQRCLSGEQNMKYPKKYAWSQFPTKNWTHSSGMIRCLLHSLSSPCKLECHVKLINYWKLPWNVFWKLRNRPCCLKHSSLLTNNTKFIHLSTTYLHYFGSLSIVRLLQDRRKTICILKHNTTN